MKITTIDIRYSYTFSMGDYSNVRPSVRYVAELEEGDDPGMAVVEMQRNARQSVQAQIDLSLEANGNPPKFYDGPRCRALRLDGDKLVAIIPMESTPSGAWIYARSTMQRHRPSKVAEYCDKLKHQENFTVYDCSDGDFSALPEVEQFEILYVNLAESNGYIILFPAGFGRREMPGRLKSWDWRWDSVVRLRQRLFDELNLEAKQRGWQFIDCTDGDLSRLPALPGDEDGDYGDD